MFVSPESSPGRNFYPRPPRGGRHKLDRLKDNLDKISIHALREEGDDVRGALAEYIKISIHALREEGDAGHRRPALRGGAISIHALREEGDPTRQRAAS